MSVWLTLDDARRHLQTGRGQGIKIAILDSGIETSHPRLADAKFADDVAIVDQGLSLSVVSGEGRDVYGHGTAVADLVHRLAPEATLGSFRVLGEQLKSRTALIRAGVREAIHRGYHILNCSFGCGREDHVLQYKDWIDEAYLRGRHVVAACNNYDSNRREWPGHFATVLTANFVQTNDERTLLYRPGHLVEFGARGQDVSVAWNCGGTKCVTGSSFAAPHVTGLLACLLSEVPELPPLQAKALLHQLATPWVQAKPASRRTPSAEKRAS